MTMQIDAHQHFWNPLRGDYDWMPMDNATLARHYAPADLAPHLDTHGIDATVLVQAAASVNETEYMLGLADATSFVAGVVGWIDFEKPSDLATLKRLSQHPKFKGVRPMIQDIADDDWMLRDDVQWGFRAVADLDLTFDALGFPRHLANFLTILKRYPDMRVVIDHCMKPQIRDHSDDNFRFWADGMTRIAQQTGACCKFSALVTEAKPGWTIEDLRPYVDHVLDTFGPARVMWGSDWPVCRLAASYQDWRAAAEALTDDLDAQAKADIYGGTAARFYRISG
ncbi:amidohydrolase family protein [Hoeflea sp. YIM 152468]|uniref:amidohydrolase family protein n=1 Tax=Hoeflea sp. YIM 152468 TaxID=3031759 RepID=UPI0023DC87F5|nr:amidohydrolase family protein [Hoeflea sp. YIM 152468]MDF1606852.1 amidohydrolase family protein [Hoeflea sp. YIM 152468]